MTGAWGFLPDIVKGGGTRHATTHGLALAADVFLMAKSFGKR
jgi:hypothetical protein